MDKSAGATSFQRRYAERIGIGRGLMFATGAALLALGVLACALPQTLLNSLVKLVGVVLLATAGIKALQFLVGRFVRSAGSRRRGWALIAGEVALDAALGLVLLNYDRTTVAVVAFAIGALFLVEGILLFLVGQRSPTNSSRGLLWATGLVSGGVGAAVLLHLVDDPVRWVGLLVGLKLLMFGGALVIIALKAPSSDSPLLYEAAVIEPVTGELYAVYFGTAFHLGVSIGDGEVVHYLNDNFVHRLTWEQFLEGREPRHWTYPDVEAAPIDRIIATALSEVGKEYPYNLLTFNCEHFAIFCKSGGATRSSRFAQIASGVGSVAAHPVLGIVAEWNTRVVEWLAFHLGGPSGKRLSLGLRAIGSSVTTWMLARPKAG